MLRRVYQFCLERLAGLERELFLESRQDDDVLKLRGKKAVHELTRALAFLTVGIKYIFFQFLLALVELAVLVVLPPKDGYELLTFFHHPELAGEGSQDSKILRFAQNDRTYEEYERKHKRTRWFSLGTFSVAVAGVVVVSLVMNLILPVAPSVLGATNIFTQTNWGGGSTSNNAIHPTNQSGWSQYSSASSEITAVNGGEDLELVSHSASSTHTTDADFNTGTYATTTVVGSGSSASVKLSKVLHINEYTIGALSNIAVTVSTVTINSNGTWTIAFSGTPNLARIFKNDKFTDSASKAWKVLSVSDSADKIIVVDSEANNMTPATGSGTVGRWYASISAWEAGRQGDITANGRNAIERGLPYYDGAADTIAVTINGWTTDATHYVEIYVPLSERHRGKWDNNKYRLVVYESYGYAFDIYIPYVRIDGLQIQNGGGYSAVWNAIRVKDVWANGTDIRISNNLIQGGANLSAGATGISMNDDSGKVSNGIVKIYNNIIYGYPNGIYLNEMDYNVYAYNNTVYNCSVGYDSLGNRLTAKNNIANNCSNGFQDAFSGSSDYNISDLASDAPGANSKNSTTVLFVSTSTQDFHLEFRDGTGNPAMNAGSDLSADANLAFTTDIDGDARTGTWDIGVDDVGPALVMTHSIGTASRDFSTLQAWEDARGGNLTTRKVFKISGQSAAFGAGETIANGDNIVANNGTATGTNYWTPSGKFSAAFDASGDDYVAIPYNLAFNTNTFTIETWYKSASSDPTSWQRIVGRSNALNFRGLAINPTSTVETVRVEVQASNGSQWVAEGTSDVADQNWHFIVGTYDGTSLKIYVDGNLEGSTTPSPSTLDVTSNTNDITIGSSAGGSFVNGVVDEVAIYNNALLLSEIQTHCGWNGSSCANPAERTGKEADLVGLWHFNEGSGALVSDTVAATGTYISERATPSASETYMTLDGGAGTYQQGEVVQGGTSNATATISAILTTAGTIEKGEAYEDSTFTAGVTFEIDGSTTDANHYIWLTAEPGSRHTGVAGTGMKLQTSGTSVSILDNYTHFEWFEIIQDSNGIFSVTSAYTQNRYLTLNNLMIHAGAGTGGSGIDLADYPLGTVIRNSFIYGFSSGKGIQTYYDDGGQYLTVQNVTLYGNEYGGIRRDQGGNALLKNIVSVGNIIDFNVNAGSWGAFSSNNISSDATAPGTGSLTNKSVSDLRFVSTASDFIDLHILDGSVAKDAGADLSATFTSDIDGQTRPSGVAFDAGADEWFSSSPVYNSSGTFTSGTIDLGNPVNFDTLSWNATVPSAANGAGMEISSTTTGLVGLWHFNEGTGQTATDTLGGGNTVADNGTLGATSGADATDPTWTTSGKFANALSFDGADDYLNMGDPASLDMGTGDFSISAWIKADTTQPDNYSTIVHKGGITNSAGYWFLIDSASGKIRIQLSDGGDANTPSSTGTADLRDNLWHYVVAVVNRGGNGRVYVDGFQEGTPADFSGESGSLNNSTALGISRLVAGSSYRFKGLIDEVAVYNRALSADEIRLHYVSFKLQMAAKTSDAFVATDYVGPDGTANTYFTQPVGLWHLNESQGASAPDTSGKGNNGVLAASMTTTLLAGDSGASGWNSSGRLDKALEFDGTDDYATIGAVNAEPFDLSGTFSVSLWVNTSDASGKILNKAGNQAGDIEFRLQTTSASNAQYQFFASGGDKTFDFSYTQGAWQHIVVVRDNTAKTVTIYNNGAKVVPAASYTGTPDSNNFAFFIGAGENTAHTARDTYFNGLVDEVSVYNRVLSDVEVNALYNSGAGREGAVLVTPASLDNNRYLRYKAYFSTADSAFSPQMDDVAVNYAYYATTSPSLISSPYNTNDATNILGKIAWTATTTAGTEARVQVRSAPNSGGVPGTWSSWCGYSACDDTDYFATSTNNVDLGASHPLKNGGNDQWLQYKVIFVSTGAATPTFGGITLTYVVNAPPDLRNVAASQRTSDGKVDVVYEARDTDTATGTTTPGLITPSFSYSTDGGQNWTAITSGYLSVGNLSNKQVCDGAGTYGGLNCAVTQYTQYTATWDAKAQLNGTYATNTKIMVTATDNEGANNTASLASSVFTLDVKNPTATVTVDGTKSGQAGAIAISSFDDSSAQMMFSNRSDYAADGLNGSSGSWIATSTSLTWTFASGDPVRVYGKVKDAYQNETTVAPDAPNTPANATIQDTSNLNLSEFREFVSWSVNAAGDFGSYKVYRSTDGSSYSLLSTIANLATNYLQDGSSGAWLSNGTTYYYKLTAQDSSGNISRYSSVVSDIPDGQGGTDVTPPTISGLSSSNINTTQATISWTTDELSNSTVYYSTDSSYSSSKAVASMVTAHSVTLTGLTPGTAYNFRARSTDPLSNVSSYATGTPFTTAQGPVISGVTAVSVSGNSATIVWNTNSNSDSWVIYSTNSDLSGSQTTGTSTLVGGSGPNYEHRVSLSSLNTNAKYYFKVRSVDGSSNAAEDNNGGAYYTFSTAQDVTAPVISSVSAILSSQTSSVISWLTNESADSQVVYGLDQNSLTSQTSVNSTMTINHSMILSNLTAGALYYYKVISADSSGNSTQSAVYSFSTTALALENTLVVTRYVESGPPVVIDRTPPLITDVKVDGITESEATVIWRTNEEADSFVEYGPPDILGLTRGQRESVKAHRVILMDLKSNARYAFKATSADASGNVSVSLPVNFQTLSLKTVAEKIGEQIEQSAREKIKDFKIENQDDIARLTKEIEEIIAQASSKVAPPRITGADPKVEVSSSFAVIYWVTDRPASSVVAYAALNDYAPENEDPYKAFVGNADEQVTEHRVVLSDLASGATYHYQVRSKGLIGGVGKSNDYTFKTTEEGSISGVEIKEITKDSAVIFWRTNISATTLLNYGMSANYGSSQSDSALNVSHTAILRNLQPGTFYHFKIGGTDKNGNAIASPDLTFTTESLPSMLNVKIDAVKEREMMITWYTDVLSDSTVEYTNLKTSKAEAFSDKQMVRNHTLAVTGLEEDAPYKFRAVSRDEKGNEVKSSEYNLQTTRDREPPEITNIQTQSAVSGKDRVQTIVSWRTSEPSSSRVTYQEGVVKNPELERSSPLDNDLKMSHVVVFTDLKPGAVYRLKIESVDAANNAAQSRDLTILTPQRKETVIDLIIKNFQDVFRWTEKMR